MPWITRDKRPFLTVQGSFAVLCLKGRRNIFKVYLDKGKKREQIRKIHNQLLNFLNTLIEVMGNHLSSCFSVSTKLPDLLKKSDRKEKYLKTAKRQAAKETSESDKENEIDKRPIDSMDSIQQVKSFEWIGSLQLLIPMGTGTSATVYKVVDPRTHFTYALKIIQ
ncbi:hypothetical protein RFI_37230, partial [Reticulomyxa filosa]